MTKPDIESAIAQTRAAWHRAPFDWGKANCGFSVGAYVALLTGRDPSAFWWDRCRNKDDALRLMEDAGGNAGLIRAAFARIGILPKQEEPRRGDVVTAQIGPVVVPGVFLGPFLMVRGQKSVILTRRFEALEVFRCV